MVSKKIYIIAPYPKGKAPSQRFRFEQYIPYFQEKGYTVYFYSFLNEKTWEILYEEGSNFRKVLGTMGAYLRRWVTLFKLLPAKHIFIHREMAHLGPPIFEFILAKLFRKKFIYDFDDAIWLPNYSESNAAFHRLKYYKKVHLCMKWANQIVAGNSYLKTYALKYNSNVEVIPTTIDMRHHHRGQIDYGKDLLTIGWTGSHTTLHYLKEIVPALKELNVHHSFRFIVIANEKPNFEIPNLLFIPWNKESEIEDLLKIDLGVMPLNDDQWAKGKCGFKALQYMALGIPTLVSNVGVNSSIIQDGENGYLIKESQDWAVKLNALLLNKELRKKLGTAGKKTIQERYAVEANKEKYLRLFSF